MSSSRILIRGAVLALVAVVLALAGDALGISTLWPVLLAAAVGLAAVPLSIPRGGAFVAGAVVGWVAMAVQAALLPDTAAARAIVIAVGVLLITGIAAATADLVPLWAGLAGYAAFAGLYEPVFAASPTTFVADSLSALVTVLLASALGFGASLLGDLLASVGARESAGAPKITDGEVAR